MESVITSFYPHALFLEMFDNHSFFHTANGENRYETSTSELQHFTCFSSAFRIYSARFFSSAGINIKSSENIMFSELFLVRVTRFELAAS